MDSHFKICANKSIIPQQNNNRYLNLNQPEAEVLVKHDIEVLIYVDYRDYWQVERSGTSQYPHLDFFFGEKGVMTIESETGTLELTPGKLLIVPSWFDRRLTIKEGQCSHLYIRCNSPHLFPHLDRIELKDSLYGEELMSYAFRLLDANANYSDVSLYRQYLFGLIELLLLREINIREHENQNNLISNNVLSILNNEKVISVRELARRIGISESGLYKKCMLLYGKPPARVIMENRLHHAGMLLRYSEYSIDEIAEQIGYSSMFAFSKAFKKLMGISPSHYRRKNCR